MFNKITSYTIKSNQNATNGSQIPFGSCKKIFPRMKPELVKPEEELSIVRHLADFIKNPECISKLGAVTDANWEYEKWFSMPLLGNFILVKKAASKKKSIVKCWPFSYGKDVCGIHNPHYELTEEVDGRLGEAYVSLFNAANNKKTLYFRGL